MASRSRSDSAAFPTARCRLARISSFWPGAWPEARISVSNRNEVTQASSQRAAERLLAPPVTFSHSRARRSTSLSTFGQPRT
ncbi:hypothetical protein D3C81_2011440 [compost metagenome]